MNQFKKLWIFIILIAVVSFGCVLYLYKSKTENTQKEIKKQPELVDETIKFEGREWYPVPVTGCEEIFENQYHVTFENGVTILTNKPAQIGDTTKCWMNNWYHSKINESLDSLVFEKPY